MSLISDSGSFKNKLHSRIADFVELVFGQKANYTLRYYSNRHHLPNFKHPQDLSERILASMMSKDFLKYADYADKVKVREYIVSKGFDNLLVKQYGAWERGEDIPFDTLPKQFVLKANNGSGGHVICTDKTQLNIQEVIEQMNKTLKKVKRFKKTEPHYAIIHPMILAEELLGDGKVLPVDYKFHCIKGKVADIFVVCERENGAKYCTLDTEWNQLPYTRTKYLPKRIPDKPEHLSEMIRIAEKLSEDFEFVRVDLYDFNGKVYFGELTFSPWGGMMNSYTTEAVELLGKKFEE